MKHPALDELLTTLDVRVHAVALCEVSEGHRLVFPPMSMLTVHYVLQGGGLMHVQGEEPASFDAKSVLIVPPGGQVTLACDDRGGRDVAAHTAGRLSADGLLVFEAGEGPAKLVIASGTITATYAGGFGLFDHLCDPLVEHVEQVKFLSAAIDLLLEEVKAPGLATRAFTETLMRQCLLLILRNHFVRFGPDSPIFSRLRDPRLVRALTAILLKPGAKHTLQSLAVEAGMSRSAFSHRFIDSFDQTPFEFIHKVRLSHAAHVLRATDLPVKMIAEVSGFSSRSHFSKTFREAFGMDPSRYRELRGVSDALAGPRSAQRTEGDV